jgi:hypothetical protein
MAANRNRTVPTPLKALEHAFASVRTADEFNALLDAAEQLAQRAADRLGLVSRGGVYVPAPKAETRAAKVANAPIEQGKGKSAAPKATPAAAQITKPQAPTAGDADKEKLVAAYRATKLPGAALCHRWKVETLRAKLSTPRRSLPRRARRRSLPRSSRPRPAR